MKIAITSSCYGTQQTGATQRFRGIYRELFKRLTDTEFVVFEPRDCNIRSWFELSENVRFTTTPLSNRQHRAQKLLQGFTFWPAILKREGCDIFDNPALSLHKSPYVRTTLLIHDIRYFSQETSPATKYVARRILDRAVTQCDLVVTVSESMRNEILSLYPSLNVSVVYNAVDLEFFRAPSCSDLQLIRDKYELPDEFMLSVGHFEDRKNYKALVSAVSLLRHWNKDIRLVIVGNDNGGLEAVRKHIELQGVPANVTTLNGVSDFDISCLYRLSKLFVFPSYYEGFGIPILEAMASGCPMVLSEIPVFRELTQGQGVYFDYRKPESIAGAIHQVLSSPSERDRLIEYGNSRVRNFTFSEVSLALENVYRTLC